MAGEPWAKFFWKDWESDPALKLCSLAAQGLWMRLLCIAAASTIPGEVRIGRRPCSPSDIATIINASTEEVARLIDELEAGGVFDRAKDGAIVSRRMVRDAAEREKWRGYGKRGGRPKALKDTENVDNPPLLENEKGGVLEGVSQGSPPASPLLLPPRPPNNYPPSTPTPNVVVGARARNCSTWRAFFADWWREYPHKVGKRDAERAYRGALQRAGPAELIDGVRRYSAGKPRDRPWCNPATWLNQDRWLDEPAEPADGINGHAETGRNSALENLFLGAARAAERYAERQSRDGDRGPGDAASGPLLDGDRAGGG
jgi:hypothetical protein